MLERRASQQNAPHQNDLDFHHSKGYDTCNPPLKVTEENLVEAFAKHEFLEQLKLLESELTTRPVNECVSKFTYFLQESIKDKSSHHKKKPSQNSTFPRKPWFDQECKAAKKRLKKKAKQLKNDPDNNAIQQNFWAERRIYKSLIRKKKRDCCIWN